MQSWFVEKDGVMNFTSFFQEVLATELDIFVTDS